MRLVCWASRLRNGVWAGQVMSRVRWSLLASLSTKGGGPVPLLPLLVGSEPRALEAVTARVELRPGVRAHRLSSSPAMSGSLWVDGELECEGFPSPLGVPPLACWLSMAQGCLQAFLGILWLGWDGPVGRSSCEKRRGGPERAGAPCQALGFSGEPWAGAFQGR